MTVDRLRELLAIFAHGQALETAQGWADHFPEEAFAPLLSRSVAPCSGRILMRWPGPETEGAARLAHDFRRYYPAFAEFVRKRDPIVLGARREECLWLYRSLWLGFSTMAGDVAEVY
jgi:hypothetical protein